MERGLGIGGNYDSNLRLPWYCLHKNCKVMAQQSSNNRANVTSYRILDSLDDTKNETKTEEKKEDAQLETHSY